MVRRRENDEEKGGGGRRRGKRGGRKKEEDGKKGRDEKEEKEVGYERQSPGLWSQVSQSTSTLGKLSSKKARKSAEVATENLY